MKRSGLALLVVVGVLGVLALLAVAFVTMAQLERRASQQRLHATRALLLARSGLEDAMARLETGQDPSASGNAYRGQDWDADGVLSSFEGQQGPPGPSFDACPVSQALHPSFHVRTSAANLDPALVGVDGRQRGCSGTLEGGPYVLKILPQAGFYLNGGDPASASTVGYNAVLKRMLGTLADALDREDGLSGDGPVAPLDGTDLIDLRPSSGWQSWEQVRDLGLGGSQAKLEVLKPFLALSAWVDRKVIAPHASTPPAQGTVYQSWAAIKLARPLAASGRAPDFERIGGNIVGRAPVGLAWARTRRPALVALFAGLKGVYLDEERASAMWTPPMDAIGRVKATALVNTWTSTDDCHLAVDRLLACTSELATWDQWNAFCDGIAFTGSSDLILAKRDILKANFNPNSDLNKFNPNVSLWRSVDKSDLLVYSTEFSLLSGASALDVESAGRVTGPDGRLLALRVLRAAVAPASRLTLTAQGEFVCEDLGDPSLAGDERAFRLPGQAGVPFLSSSQGTGKTWGHALGLVGLGSLGAALQSYPEPCTRPAGPLAVAPAAYDGNLQLASVETPDDAWYEVPSPPAVPVREMKLLARYTAGLDLDVADAVQPPLSTPDADKNQPDVQQVTTAQLGFSVLDAARPNTLYPDGCYSEKDRAPSYFDKGNADGFHGVVSFWLKPNHRISGRAHPFLKWTNFMSGLTDGESLDQFFFLGDCSSFDVDSLDPGASDGIVSQFEIGHQTGTDADLNREHRFAQGTGSPHVWGLITMYYDFRSPSQNDTGRLILDAHLEAGMTDSYPTAAGNDPVSASDITGDDLYGRHRISLGGGRPSQEYEVPAHAGSGADATFDELAVYDFGGAQVVTETPLVVKPADPETLASPATLASARFKEGRYYKESDYLGPYGDSAGALLTPPGPGRSAAEYFSPVLRLGGACRIRSLAWTQVVPQGLRAPADPGPEGGILLELVNVAGDGYLPDGIERPYADAAVSAVGRTVGVPFRLHAIFQPNLANKDNTPILDPLALDDVTVVYEPVGGRRILAWGTP